MKSFIIIAASIITACSSDYLLCETTSPVPIGNESMEHIVDTIPAGKYILVKCSHFSNFCFVKHGDLEGYAVYGDWIPIVKVEDSDLGLISFEDVESIIKFISDSKGDYKEVNTENSIEKMDSTLIVEPIPIKPSPSPNKVSSSSTNPTSGGSVQVKGYYRKDGTYVKPNTRKAPTKRK